MVLENVTFDDNMFSCPADDQYTDVQHVSAWIFMYVFFTRHTYTDTHSAR